MSKGRSGRYCAWEHVSSQAMSCVSLGGCEAGRFLATAGKEPVQWRRCGGSVNTHAPVCAHVPVCVPTSPHVGCALPPMRVVHCISTHFDPLPSKTGHARACVSTLGRRRHRLNVYQLNEAHEPAYSLPACPLPHHLHPNRTCDCPCIHLQVCIPFGHDVNRLDEARKLHETFSACSPFHLSTYTPLPHHPTITPRPPHPTSTPLPLNIQRVPTLKVASSLVIVLMSIDLIKHALVAICSGSTMSTSGS